MTPIRTKTWHAVTQAEGGLPHFWLYLIDVGDDPWQPGAQRWDVYAPYPVRDRVLRGIWTPIHECCHRFEARQPTGNTTTLEIKEVNSNWIEHESADFRPHPYAPHQRTRRKLSLEHLVGYLDEACGKGVASQEGRLLRGRSLNRHLSQPMIETFITECAHACRIQPTKEILLSEPEGTILNPPWCVTYEVREAGGEHKLSVSISNRFTNDNEFTIGQDGGVDWK